MKLSNKIEKLRVIPLYRRLNTTKSLQEHHLQLNLQTIKMEDFWVFWREKVGEFVSRVKVFDGFERKSMEFVRNG